MKLLEKFFYVSLGLTSDLAEKLGSTLDKLVKESKISEIDAKKIKEDFQKSTERYARDIKKKFDELLKETLESMDFVTQKDLDEVKKRIEALEEKIDRL